MPPPVSPRRPLKPGVRAAAVLLLVAGFFEVAAAAAAKTIEVEGRITDADGKGLPGQSVRLFKTRRQITLSRFESGGQVAEAARVASDESGFYKLSVPKDRSFDEYYLRFYDPNSFDAVQFAIPPDRNITKDLRHGGTLRIDVALSRNPAWSTTAQRIESLGADSPKGRILRALGQPEREEMGEGPDGPREEWWYHTKGVVYFFKDGKAAGSRRFDPVQPSRAIAPQEASAGGGR